MQTEFPEPSGASEDTASSKRGSLRGIVNEGQDEEADIEGAADTGSHERSTDPEVTSLLCKPGEIGEQLHPCSSHLPHAEPPVADNVLVHSIEIGGSTSMEMLEAVTQPEMGTQAQADTQVEPVPQPQLLSETEKEVHIEVVVHEEQTVPDQQTRKRVDEGEAVRIEDGEGSKQLGEGELRSELPIEKKVPPTPAISKRSLRSNLVQEEDVEVKAPQPKRKKQKHTVDEAKVTHKKRSSKR